jgi:hypothetical protein
MKSNDPCKKLEATNNLPTQVKIEAEINHIQFELNAFNNDLLKLDEICIYEIIAKYLDDDVIKIKDAFEKFLKKLDFSKVEIDRIIASLSIMNDLDHLKANLLIDLEKEFFNYYKRYVQKTVVTPSQSNILLKQKYFLMRLGKAFFCNSNIQSLLVSQPDTLVNSFFKSFVGFLYEVSYDTIDQLKPNLLTFLSLIDKNQLQLKIKFVDMAQTYERQKRQNPKFGKIPFSFSSILIQEFILCCQNQDYEKALDYIYGTAAIDFNQISNQLQTEYVDALSTYIQDQNHHQIAYKTLAFLGKISQDKCEPFYRILQLKFPKTQNLVAETLTTVIRYIEYYLHQDLQGLTLFNDQFWQDQMIHLLCELSPEMKADKIKLMIQGMHSDQAVTYQKMEKLLNEIQNHDHILLHFFLEECLHLFPQDLGANGNNNKIRVLRFLKNHHLFGELLSKSLLKKINAQVLDLATFSYFEFLSETDVIAYFKTHLNQTTFLLTALEKDYIHSDYRFYIDNIIPFLSRNQNITNLLKVLAKNNFVRSLNQQDINLIENRIMAIFQQNQINNQTIPAFKFMNSFEKENNIPLNSALEMNRLIDHFFGFHLENTAYVQKKEMYTIYYKEVQISLIEVYLKNYLRTYQQDILCSNTNAALYEAFESLTEGIFTNTIDLISDASVKEIYDLIVLYCNDMFNHMTNPTNSPLNINLSKLKLILNDWLLPLEKRLSKSSIAYQSVLPLIQSNLFYNPQWNEQFPNAPNQAPNPMFAYACLLNFIYKLNPNQTLIINSVHQSVSQHIKYLLALQIERITKKYRDISSIINQTEDFIKSKDCSEDIIFSGIELVMPTSEILVEYLNANQSIVDEHKKEFLLSMDYTLRKALPEIIELKTSQELRNRWADVYQFKVTMKMQKRLLLKYPQNQTDIEKIISDFQKKLCISNPSDDFTSNLFNRMMSRLFSRSFHIAVDNLPSQFNVANVENIVLASQANIENSVNVIRLGVGQVGQTNFEEILRTYFMLRYTIANYLRFFDEYGPYQDILNQGFNEIFANRNLQKNFEDRSNKILEKIYLKKRQIRIEELKNSGSNIEEYDTEIKPIFD